MAGTLDRVGFRGHTRPADGDTTQRIQSDVNKRKTALGIVRIGASIVFGVITHAVAIGVGLGIDTNMAEVGHFPVVIQSVAVGVHEWECDFQVHALETTAIRWAEGETWKGRGENGRGLKIYRGGTGVSDGRVGERS